MRFASLRSYMDLKWTNFLSQDSSQLAISLPPTHPASLLYSQKPVTLAAAALLCIISSSRLTAEGNRSNGLPTTWSKPAGRINFRQKMEFFKLTLWTFMGPPIHLRDVTMNTLNSRLNHSLGERGERGWLNVKNGVTSNEDEDGPVEQGQLVIGIFPFFLSLDGRSSSRMRERKFNSCVRTMFRSAGWISEMKFIFIRASIVLWRD